MAEQRLKVTPTEWPGVRTQCVKCGVDFPIYYGDEMHECEFCGKQYRVKITVTVEEMEKKSNGN